MYMVTFSRFSSNFVIFIYKTANINSSVLFIGKTKYVYSKDTVYMNMSTNSAWGGKSYLFSNFNY